MKNKMLFKKEFFYLLWLFCVVKSQNSTGYGVVMTNQSGATLTRDTSVQICEGKTGCENPKIDLSGVQLERPMSSSGLLQADDDDVKRQQKYIICENFNCLAITVQRQPGAPCTLDGFPGRCVEMKRCLYLFETFKLKQKPQTCPSDGDEPLVCCTDCKLVDDINDITVDPQSGILYKDGRKSWDYCIDNLKRLPYPCKKHFFFTLFKKWVEEKKCHNVTFTTVGVAGGKDAEEGEFPHMALLGYGDDEDSLNWVCGGSIISENFILTAAHCSAHPKYGPVTYAALGILKRSDPQERWKKHRIQDVIPHPQYKSPVKYHDIALLRTFDRIQFFELVLPACLPTKRTKIDLHGYGVAAGWGALGRLKSLADTLQKIIVSKYSTEDCSALYQPHRHLKEGFNETIQLCYGHKEEVKDTCEGDSGGPLHLNIGCAFDVIGVTSYGQTCGIAGQAGVYTRVEHYVPWIESIVWP